jgi:hypothetical protein
MVIAAALSMDSMPEKAREMVRRMVRRRDPRLLRICVTPSELRTSGRGGRKRRGRR